jgi:hypothetical protein
MKTIFIGGTQVFLERLKGWELCFKIYIQREQLLCVPEKKNWNTGR